MSTPACRNRRALGLLAGSLGHWIALPALLYTLLFLAACRPIPLTPAALDRGAALMTAGFYTAAEAAFQEALQEAPQDPQPALYLADLYMTWGRYEPGLVALEEAASRGASLAEVQGRRLALLERAGRWEEVQTLAKEVLAGDAADLNAWAALTQSHLYRHECADAAIAAGRHIKAYRLSASNGAPPNVAAAALPQAVAASARIQGVLSGDAALLDAADPDLATGLPELAFDRNLTLGLRLVRTGDWGLAACVLERAVTDEATDSPSDFSAAQAHTWLGEALVRLGAVQNGEAHLRIAVELAPESAVSWLLLGQHHLTQGSLDTARIALLNAQRLDPANPAPCLALAELKAAAGKYDEVDRWIEAALIRAPNDPEVAKAAARFYLARWLDTNGQALAIARGAVELAPQDAEAYTLTGWALFRTGEIADARQTLAHAIVLDPTSAEAYYWQAAILERLNMMDEASASRIRAADLGYPVETAMERP